LKLDAYFAIQATEQLSPVVNRMNRKPAAVAQRTWHSLWDEMFAAVAELEPEHETSDAASEAASSPGSELDLLTLRAQPSNDNARRS
jgi:hypothetical protein